MSHTPFILFLDNVIINYIQFPNDVIGKVFPKLLHFIHIQSYKLLKCQIKCKLFDAHLPFDVIFSVSNILKQAYLVLLYFHNPFDCLNMFALSE